MGLILDYGCYPHGLFDICDNGIVSVHRHILHRDRLLSGSAVPIKALSKHRDYSLCLVSHLEIAASRLKIFRRCDQARRYMSSAASCATTICDASIPLDRVLRLYVRNA
jgi:hypothetical protein